MSLLLLTVTLRGVSNKHCLLSLFSLLQIIDCGYSLEQPTIYVLSKYKKIVRIFHLKIIIFTAFKNCHIIIVDIGMFV